MRQVGSRLYRACADAMAANSFFDDTGRLLKNLIYSICGKMIFVDDITADLLMDIRPALLHREFRVDNRW